MPEFKMDKAAATNRDVSSTRQLTLDRLVRSERKHGGVRPGAGRPRKKDGERTFIAHRRRPPHRKGDPIHVTLRVKKRIPSLRRQAAANIVKSALLDQRKQLTDKNAKHFQVVHFTIQDDHLHLIVEASDKRGIARGVAGLEIRIARRLNRLLGRNGKLWSERYHRRDLRTPTETRNALRYVLLNLHKHRRVIGDRAFADPCSSAGTFDGFTRPLTIFAERNPWPSVLPRTWLLDVGWRRYGPLDPADVPVVSASRTRRS